MARAVSVIQLLTKKREVMNFEGKWEESFGRPELTGSWIIWGNSGNGKTSFALQLCKYLSRFVNKIAYNSLEESDGESIARAFQIVGMEEVAHAVVLLAAEPIPKLIERLKRRKSPQVVVIDSLQYTGITYKEYQELKEEFPRKLFIWISHGEGREPKGQVAQKVRYDAGMKIFIEGYMAYPASRYGGGAPFVVWEEKARELNIIK